MECACEVDVYCDEYSDILTKERRTANKIHKCSECGDDIQPGDTYEYYKGSHDVDIFTNKTCIDCLSIRDTFFTDFYFGQILELLHEFISEVRGQVHEECIAALTPSAQSLVCSAIDEEWREYWLDNPTQAAQRLDLWLQMPERWKRPGWLHCRQKEMLKMDDAVWHI